MRMHRGSSKVGRGPPPAAEDLPLSASAVEVELAITRGRGVEARAVRVAPGTTVRAALRAAGQAPEGCAVLLGGQPIPLSTPLVGPVRLVVVPTFSGG